MSALNAVGILLQLSILPVGKERTNKPADTLSRRTGDKWSPERFSDLARVTQGLSAILKQKCQCLLKKKLNFFGYNYVSMNKKGHVPTAHTVVKYFITTPSCNTLYRGTQGVFEQIRERVTG